LVLLLSWTWCRFGTSHTMSYFAGSSSTSCAVFLRVVFSHAEIFEVTFLAALFAVLIKSCAAGFSQIIVQTFPMAFLPQCLLFLKSSQISFLCTFLTWPLVSPPLLSILTELLPVSLASTKTMVTSSVISSTLDSTACFVSSSLNPLMRDISTRVFHKNENCSKTFSEVVNGFHYVLGATKNNVKRF
jgi:hypothetical protein